MQISGQEGSPRKLRFDALQTSWNLMMSDWGTWLICFLLFSIISTIARAPFSIAGEIIMQGQLRSTPTSSNPYVLWQNLLSSPAYLVSWIASMASTLLVNPLYGGIAYTGLRRLRGEAVTVGTMFELRGAYWKLVGLWAMYYGAFIPVFLLLAVTGFSTLAILIGGIFGLLSVLAVPIFMPAQLLILDQGLAPFDALAVSARGVLPNYGMSWVLRILSGLLALAGVLACCVGFLLTANFPLLLEAEMYRQLFENPSDRTGNFHFEPPPPGSEGYEGHYPRFKL